MVSHLVVVCCHGIWTGGEDKGSNEAEWLIASFQKGETPTFMEHVRAGIEIVEHDENAALFFSGGPTRKETRLSEAQSYLNIGLANGWISPAIAPRIHTESRALDSYFNILFSLTAFHRQYGTWPTHMTIVSHAFKEPRIVGHHCAAIGFPAERITYRGIDPPGIDLGDVGVMLALGQWADDPHGRGEALAGKRNRRNPWKTEQGVWDGQREEQEGGLIVKTIDGVSVLDEDAARPWI